MLVVVSAVLFKTNRRDHKEAIIMKPLVGLIVRQSVLDALKLPEENPSKFLLRISWMTASVLYYRLLCFITCSATNNTIQFVR